MDILVNAIPYCKVLPGNVILFSLLMFTALSYNGVLANKMSNYHGKAPIRPRVTAVNDPASHFPRVS